jgi:hypothetical protein
MADSGNGHKDHEPGYDFEEAARRMRSGLERHGWYAHYVCAADHMPGGVCYHTHGLDMSTGHPDLQIVLPINHEVAHGIFHQIADRIKAGEEFEAGKVFEGVTDFGAMLVEAKEKDRPVMRVIIPDGEGNFEQESMDPDYAIQWENLESVE